MIEAIYMLFISFCMFFISLCGALIAISMWRKSNSLCDECKKELDK